MTLYEEVKKRAFEALSHAYAPYSGFCVGACIAMKDGSFISGANIENASYGLTNCAERSAVFAAYSQGYRKEDITAMAVVTKAAKLTTPCGACRQVLSELLQPDTPVILSNGNQEKITCMRELLPFSFGEEDLSQENNHEDSGRSPQTDGDRLSGRT